MIGSGGLKRLRASWSHFFNDEDVGSFISGRLLGGDGELLVLTNPADGKPFLRYRDTPVSFVNEAMHSAAEAQSSWVQLTPADRGRILAAIGGKIRDAKEPLAELEALTVGKPIRDALVEVDKVAEMFDYYSGWCDKLHGEVIPVPTSHLNYTRREPVGIVVQVTPWNAPLFTAGWQVAPALATGNASILKPSELTPMSSLALARIIHDTDVPSSLFQVLVGSGTTVGSAAITHRQTDKVVFVGSRETGRVVAEQCARELKPAILELGGKSANIVFADAPYERALKGAQKAIFASAGQSCVAGSRLLVQDSLYEHFVEELAQRAAQIPMGHPLDPFVQIGPINNEKHFTRVNAMVASGVADGCRIVEPKDPGSSPAEGYYLPPIVLAQATNQMAVAREEIFGPVVVAIPFRDESEAVAIANDSSFDLAGGVWTQDIGRAHRVASRVRAGTFWINSYKTRHVSSPFGGFSGSGYGRSSGIEALHSYTQTKSVWVETAESPTQEFGA